MDKEAVRRLLPEGPREGMFDWVLQECQMDEELGPQYLVWKPERVSEQVFDGWYNPDDFGVQRTRRMANCRCGACGYQFYTELDGQTLTFYSDDCGDIWPMDFRLSGPYQDAEDDGSYVEIDEGEAILCPFCEIELRAIRDSKLRGGRKKQILVASVEKVGGYAAVVYWLVARHIYEDGNSYETIPRDAYVLDEKGRIVRYSHKTGGGFYKEVDAGEWRAVSGTRDSVEIGYHDWGSINNRKKGSLVWQDVPELEGTTGEKTGITEYIMQDGALPLTYWKLWKKVPALENLVVMGWIRLVEGFVNTEHRGFDAMTEMLKALNLSKRKPHEMLGISRQEMKGIRAAGRQWDMDTQILNQKYLRNGMAQGTFWDLYKECGKSGINALMALNTAYGMQNTDKLRNYMAKNNMTMKELGILLDTREAAAAMQQTPLTEEQLWPRNLMEAHDRLTRIRNIRIDPKKEAEFMEGFRKVCEDYAELEWTDGELCIRLPRRNADLVEEGEILRHCVGGYGCKHIERRDVIFFVRKYRRPERCYYTLDIRMKGRPEEIQLHGYGNERHGEHKQHRHRIPEKVRKFVDRWEQEVLIPWYQEQQKKEEKTA